MKKAMSFFIPLATICGVVTVTAFALSCKAPQAAVNEGQASEANIAMMSHRAAIAESSNQSVPEKEVYEAYAKYGMRFNESTQKLYYNDKLVRCFDDLTDLDGNTFGIEYYCELGVVDISAKRDTNNIKRNADGGYDPKGVLTGLRLHTENEFAARDLSVYHRGKEMAVAYAGEPLTPSEKAEMFAVYEPFGMTYDKEADTIYFDDQPVRTLIDILQSNGDSLTDGTFSGTMHNYGSRNGGTIDIYTVRDFNKTDSSGYGTLTGIEKYSQEEFERRTDTVWLQS